MNRAYQVALPVVLTLLACGACGGTDSDAEGSQSLFWRNLTDRCGESYAGRATMAPEGDTVVAGRNLVMHIMECGDREIRIPFHVGENRSRARNPPTLCMLNLVQ